MSDSSSVIDESNRPLQGTEIPALQGPLTTPDDDYPLPAAATISMTLPRELVERILLLLHAEYILACRLVSKEFNEIIQSSTLLQYFLVCKAAGVADNPRSPLSYAERREALEKREDAWRQLKPVFDMTISLNRQKASASHGSIEGVYFVRDDNQKDLNYCQLTSFPQDDPRWIRIPGHRPTLDRTGLLVNFVAALNEHDLIVNFISSYIGNQTDMQRHTLDLVLLKSSTGEYHPLACRPRIHVQRSPEVEPWIVSKIVGDNLALVVHSRDGTFSDKLFIFDWKTGRKLLQHDAGENAYSDLDFVSPEILFVPNRVLSHLEVWHLAPQQVNPSPPIQILSLKIPAVSPKYSIFEFRCYGAPNPFLHSMPYLPPRPFFSSPENSIITVTLRMSSNPDGHATSYNLIMHRRALLDTIQTWTSPSLLEQQELPWAKWGPRVSRWFQVSDTQARWPAVCNGQRCAFSEPNLLDRRKLKVSVADFNPYNFRRNAEMMARLRSGECDNNGSNGNKGKEEEQEEFEIMDHKGVFLEEVYMGLKCVVYRAPDEYDFDLVLMDEERLFGVKVRTWRWHRTFLTNSESA
ncbi:hypothetical protein JOM56_005354 [Amanita muscaria]